jgi:hypothetical protein
MIMGIMPGVLFLVTRQCVQGVILSTCLAVGFRDSMMLGALVICSIVRMGELSITLCSASCCKTILSFVTLCSSSVGGGASIVMILSRKSHRRRLPLGVCVALVAPLVNSLVRACKC